jgi:NAD(P)-dependent dehydrogenase (short-subunit alcohol dehydrogenase family)
VNHPPTGSLAGRVALVTGAGGGIGAATARLLAAEGAAVVVNDLGVALDGSPGDRGAADVVADEIRSAGGEAHADRTDVTDYDAVERLFADTVERFGKLDVVAHVAGILRDRMLFNMTPEEWAAVQQVHLTGLFNLGRQAAAYWRDLGAPDGRYRLITFTSRSGLRGAPAQPNYAAAKMGVVGFTYSCARALARYGVATICICPTADTRMTATMGDRAERPPGSDAGSPDNVARVVAYAAGPDSDWLNGQVIGANGFEVALYNRPAILESVTSDGPWTLADLGRAMDERLRPRAVPPEGLERL